MARDDDSELQMAGRDLSGIAAPDGTLRMIAIDQRESLRTLLASAGHPSANADLTTFKVDVAAALSGAASGLLVDPVYGLDAVVRRGAVADGCGIVVAVDRLIQEPGGPLLGSELDETAMAHAVTLPGVRALKFLVVWRPADPPADRLAMAGAFVDGCRRLGVLSLLEGMVQVADPADTDAFDDALVAAANEFGALRPDVYKTHVPSHGAAPDARITARSSDISTAIGRPWVVLSAGVEPDRFPEVLRAACDGGASGFLAGRGVWGPAIRTADTAAALRTDAADRLARIVDVAAAAARPWWEARKRA